MTRTATFQPDVRRFSSIKPLPTIRVTCPTYIGDQRNEKAIGIRDRMQASIDAGTFEWYDDDGQPGTVAAVRDFIKHIADPTGALGLGVVIA